VVNVSADSAIPDSSTIVRIVEDLDKSVVGIIGKLAPDSDYYYEYSNNIISGSGIIYKENGYVITNAHVVEDLESIFVILSNKKIYKASLVAIDVSSDIALIKIDKGMQVPVKLADSSQVQVGMAVLIIGTPMELGLQNSVSLGIVSGLDRIIPDLALYCFIQTDAASNPGNSGGPLLNMDGEVIGIVSGGYTYYQGLTFCIPSNMIEYVMTHFEEYGYVKRPSIGAKIIQSLAADYSLHSEEGVLVTEIEAGMAADNAGIMDEDILLSINGTNIYSEIGYNEELIKYAPGETITVRIDRDGTIMELSVILDEEQI